MLEKVATDIWSPRMCCSVHSLVQCSPLVLWKNPKQFIGTLLCGNVHTIVDISIINGMIKRIWLFVECHAICGCFHWRQASQIYCMQNSDLCTQGGEVNCSQIHILYVIIILLPWSKINMLPVPGIDQTDIRSYFLQNEMSYKGKPTFYIDSDTCFLDTASLKPFTQ